MSDQEGPSDKKYRLPYQRSPSYREDAVDGFNWQFIEGVHGSYTRLTATHDVINIVAETFPAIVDSKKGVRQTGPREYEQVAGKVELFTARMSIGAAVDLAILLAKHAHRLGADVPQKIREALMDSEQNG